MQAVSESKSEEILRQIDHLISEGHSPTHFARQMVRFLRNATVAKIAGKDSSLLQISSEERERVARVADLFGEEDLTRHFQIMLRTHNELGYKQEQRFHLELGLLKMAHAQKLLPIEQLLSDAGVPATPSVQRPAARPAIVGGSSSSEPRRPEAFSSARPTQVSPFAADSARKGTPRQEASADSALPSGPRIVASASAPEPVIMGAAALAPQRESSPAPNPDPAPEAASSVAIMAPVLEASPIPDEPSSSSTTAEPQIDRLREAVLQALANGNQHFLVSMLSGGEWSVRGNELVIQLSESQTVVDMSVSNDAKRLAIASASGVLGRAVKFKVVGGANVAPQDNKRNGTTQTLPGVGGRARAEQDPVVRRMRDKFGAEIRTVIDYRDKR